MDVKAASKATLFKELRGRLISMILEAEYNDWGVQEAELKLALIKLKDVEGVMDKMLND